MTELPPIAVPELIARLDALVAAHGPGVVAFDGDCTFWSGDVGDDFLHAFLERGELRPEAAPVLARAAARSGGDEGLAGRALLRRLVLRYEEGSLDEELFYELTAVVCAGWARHEVDAFVRQVLAAVPLAPRLHGEAMALVGWARERGVAVRIVSASPAPVVVLAAEAVGVRPDEVIAVTAEAHGEVTGTAARRPIPYGPGKVEALRGQVGSAPLHAAFGDNRFDVDLLRAATVPVAIRPKARLRAAASLVPGLLELRPVDFPGSRH